MDLNTFYKSTDKALKCTDDSTISSQREEDEGSKPKVNQEKELIGIDGYWYDVTNFIPYHPGGDVIREFVGKDASAVFHAFHKQTVLKHRKPYGTIEVAKQDHSKIGQAFTDLRIFFEKEGYFETDHFWYAKKFFITFVLFVICLYCSIVHADSNVRYVGAFALAAFWQQCGFFMHDFEHDQLTHNRHVDKWFGSFFGTVCFGISGGWWRKEHFIHHALTICVSPSKKFADPQMHEPVIWAQHEKLWPFYQSRLAYCCIKIQHFTFIPLCVIAGRLAIIVASLARERDLIEFTAFLLHCTWVTLLLSNFPSAKDMAIFYAIAAIIQGVLHIQLLISHYAKDYHDLEDVGMNLNWYQMQVESNIDIITPLWLDWFHGGLNFHLVHHLYPRMPRHNFRKATEYVKQVCDEHGLIYDHCGWFEAVTRTLHQLKHSSEHFSLDPR
ncbi:uncharacterized protein [Watersipora subatra]|uniref:uncharacterized protein n=1 Tax=Watersipora subatra TaxID=2589382 RepID=UPI00355B231D